MIAVSLFSGIGGFDLAMVRTGMKVLDQVEIDKAAQNILRRHFPDAELFDDIKTYTPHGSVDLICGGFPCQDVSIAGRRAGLAGERSGLWHEFYRIVEQTRPRWVVVENVPGLLSSNGGRDFAVIIHGLAKCGYGVAWRILDAQYFGVAQRRRRVFIVGHLGDGRAAEVLFEREGLPGNTPPRREAGQEVTEISGTLSANKGGTERPAGNANELDFCVVARPLAYSSTTNHQDESQQTYIAFSAGQSSHELTEALPELSQQSPPAYGVRRLTPLEAERLQGFPDGWTAGQADSTRYRQLGNAVAVPVVEWIFKRIRCSDDTLPSHTL